MEKFTKLILASASPRRADLLREAHIDFEVVRASVVEHEDPSTDPITMVKYNALIKAKWVQERCPERWVLGADTTVDLDGKALNKPATMDEARLMLSHLSGRGHKVYTGVHLLGPQEQQDAFVVFTDVFFKPMNVSVIEHYYSMVNPLDKAGGYGIHEGTDIILESIEGSFTNVMGLPMERLLQRLKFWQII